MRGLRLLKPVKPPLYPSGPRRVKRTRIANQMKRVQRVEDSLAQSGAAAVRLPHFAPTDSPRKTLQSQCSHAKTHSAAPPTPFPVSSVPPRSLVSFVLRRDRHMKTRNLEVNQQSRITAPTIRERTNGDHDPRRNRNGTYRKPSCLTLCVKQQA